MRFWGYLYRITFGSKIARATRKNGAMGTGRVRVEKEAFDGKDPRKKSVVKYGREKLLFVGVRKENRGMVLIKMFFQVGVCFF